MTSLRAGENRRRIAVLPGDGVGPEVTVEAQKVLRVLERALGEPIEVNSYDLGGAAFARHGDVLPKETYAACEAADAILVGAVGGPEFMHLPAHQRPESSLLRLRQDFQLYANVRPARLFPSLAGRCPLRAEVAAQGFDFVVVRELCGGAYYGRPKGIDKDENGVEVGFDNERYTQPEIERVVTFALALAKARRKRLTSIDKENVLMSSRLWRKVATRVAQADSDVTFENVLADNMAMQLILAPGRYDVIVGSNLFGDLLSDEAGALCGSLGVLPSASIGDNALALYEPVHGTAPDIAGKGLANPVGAILSVGMMMTWTFKRPDLEERVWRSVNEVLRQMRTADVWENGTRKASTSEMGDAIVKRLEEDR